MNDKQNILCLCGGVGGAKLAYGFSKVLAPENLNIVVNTGDDFEHLGFPISPDLDTVTYTLSEQNNTELGWGLAGETWQFMSELKTENPSASWFQLGDKDLETHRFRKQLLQQGQSLSEATRALCKKFSIAENIIPMSDDPVHTIIQTQNDEDLAFQHYFVREQCQPPVKGFYFRHIEQAKPSSGFIECLRDKDLKAVVICPSNPFVSVDPILSLPGIKKQLQNLSVPVIAVSPIIGGQAVKGPTAKMMDELQIPKTSAAIAKHYEGLVDYLILDNSDTEDKASVEALGMQVAITKTLMKENQDKVDLANFILNLL